MQKVLSMLAIEHTLFYQLLYFEIHFIAFTTSFNYCRCIHKLDILKFDNLLFK